MIIEGKYYPSAKVFLLLEWEKKKAANPRFSLRSLSRHFRISKSTMSGLLTGTRPLSKKNAQLIAEICKLKPEDAKELFWDSEKSDGEDLKQNIKNIELSDETFNLISDWYHVAILALASIKDCPSSPEWIADKLGIGVREARLALNKLESLSLLERQDENIVTRPNALLTVLGGMPSMAVKKYHRQNLQNAENSLMQDPVTRRDFSSITIPVNEKNITELRKLIGDFRLKAKKIMQQGKANSVYTLAIQLFPLTKQLRGEKNEE